MSTRYGLDFELHVNDKNNESQIRKLIEDDCWEIDDWKTWEDEGTLVIAGYAESVRGSSFGCEFDDDERKGYESQLKPLHDQIVALNGGDCDTRWVVVYVEAAPTASAEFGPSYDEDDEEDHDNFAVPI